MEALQTWDRPHRILSPVGQEMTLGHQMWAGPTGTQRGTQNLPGSLNEAARSGV